MEIQRETEASLLKTYLCTVLFLKNISANTFLMLNLPADNTKYVAEDCY